MNTENKTQTVRLPILHGYTKEFYDWCHKQELRFQRCQTVRDVASSTTTDV